MKQKICILLIEDFEDDALLILRELRKGGFEPSYKRVESEEEMRKALKHMHWDVILSDHNLPTFNALSALALLKELKTELPFIVVSGSMNEQMCYIARRSGAYECIAKDDMNGLVTTIKRCLGEKKLEKKEQ